MGVGGRERSGGKCSLRPSLSPASGLSCVTCQSRAFGALAQPQSRIFRGKTCRLCCSPGHRGSQDQAGLCCDTNGRLDSWNPISFVEPSEVSHFQGHQRLPVLSLRLPMVCPASSGHVLLQANAHLLLLGYLQMLCQQQALHRQRC